MKELWPYKLDSESYTPTPGVLMGPQGTLGVTMGAQRGGKKNPKSPGSLSGGSFGPEWVNYPTCPGPQPEVERFLSNPGSGHHHPNPI